MMERREESLRDGIEVRWGSSGDEGSVSELLELNGMSRAPAFEDRFIVAVGPDGGVLAALRYRLGFEELVLGLLVADPWVEERPLARALYAGAGSLAHEVGVGEVLARDVACARYPREAGYRRRGRLWRLEVLGSCGGVGELPAGGWRRVAALLGVAAVPFFRGFDDREGAR